MIIKIRVMPRAKFNRIQELDGDALKIYTTAPAVDDKANIAVVEMLADYFKVKKSVVCIISGRQSRNKVIGIDE